MSGQKSLILFPLLLIAIFCGCDSIPSLEPAQGSDSGFSVADSNAMPAKKPLQEKPIAAEEGVREQEASVAKALSPAGHSGDDTVLARVEGREIRASDLFQAFYMVAPDRTRDVLETLVIDRLVRREAEALGIEVEPKAVDFRIDRLLADQQATITAKLDKDLTLEEYIRGQYSMSMPAYQDLIRPNAVFQLLLERCVRYTELRVRRLRIGVILIEDLSTADTIHKKLMKGASFEVLAREHSLDPSGTLGGGILPPLPADMDFPVIQAGLKLGVGEISEVDESNLGRDRVYRIVKLVEMIEPLHGSFSELEETVKSSLEEEPLWHPEILRYWQDAMKQKYQVEYCLPLHP